MSEPMRVRKRIALESDEEEEQGEKELQDDDEVVVVEPVSSSSKGRPGRFSASNAFRDSLGPSHKRSRAGKRRASHGYECDDDFVVDEDDDGDSEAEEEEESPPKPRRRSTASSRRTSWVGTGKARRPRRPSMMTQERFSDDEDDGGFEMADFIVRSDDEGSEGEPANGGASGGDNDDEVEVIEAAKPTKPTRRSSSIKKSQEKARKGGRKKKAQEEVAHSIDGPKRKRIAMESDSSGADAGSDSGSTSGGRGSGSEGGGEEDEESSGEDEAMLHMQLHAAHELEEEQSMPLFMSRRNLSLREAFELYVEMIAMCITDAIFLEGIRKNPMAAAYGKFTSARKMLEDLVCTRRESLLGSMAWRPEFLIDLRALPNCYVVSIFDGPDRCEICNRSSHACNRSMELFGPRYDSIGVWSSARWDRSLPCTLAELSKSPSQWDGVVEERVSYSCGPVCMYKTTLYSKMIHFKLRLARRIASHLCEVGEAGNVAVQNLLRDEAWVEHEFTKLNWLIDAVEGLLIDAKVKCAKHVDEELFWTDEEEERRAFQSRVPRRSVGHSDESEDDSDY